uniref:Uncharacterized protein n=1 Tax=Parastrongyloides trichosuri TaxID=131310 RepID=A0A0N4ZUM6_PARTI
MYGWYLIFMTIILSYVYKKYIEAPLFEYWKNIEYEKRKKFDDLIKDKYSDKIAEARRKAQEKYEMNKEKYREIEKEKKRMELIKKVEELEKKQKSILELQGFEGSCQKL